MRKEQGLRSEERLESWPILAAIIWSGGTNKCCSNTSHRRGFRESHRTMQAGGLCGRTDQSCDANNLLLFGGLRQGGTERESKEIRESERGNNAIIFVTEWSGSVG